MKDKHFLDKFALILNRAQLQTKSPIVGIWFAVSDETETSDLILRFNENGTFTAEGSFHADEAKSFTHNNREYFSTDGTVRFKGSGKYSIENDRIKIDGMAAVEQEISCRKYAGKTCLSDTGFMEKSFGRTIDFNGKFTRTENGDIIKLHFEDEKGIISFGDEIFDGNFVVGGFRNFTQVVEVKHI